MGIEIIKSGKFPNNFIGFDLMILFIFLFFVLFSFAINGLGNVLSLNHTIAYISTFLLFYVSIKFTLFNIEDNSISEIKHFKAPLQVFQLYDGTLVFHGVQALYYYNLPL